MVANPAGKAKREPDIGPEVRAGSGAPIVFEIGSSMDRLAWWLGISRSPETTVIPFVMSALVSVA